MQVLLAIAVLLLHTTLALAQQSPAPLGGDGGAAPDLPNSMVQGADGRPVIRAIKLTEPFRLDGQLDEAIYQRHAGFGGMLQAAPRYGEPSTEKTEIWVSFDDDHIYVSARLWDQAPPERWIANELRRDTNQMRNNDHFGVGFDTFYDRRSGYMFYANPLGGFADYSVVDEGSPNTDWNPVWTAKTGRFDGGWTIEMAFPFKSLRYSSGTNQTWGLQFRRAIRHKNEWNYWTPVPRNMAGPQALNRVSVYGSVVGLDLPPAGRNVEIKPYALGRSTTDRLQNPPLAGDRDGEYGGDFKYGITANLTADLTVKTDFAQVEIDEQQVNLTRFNLFLPEKRDFFLEGRGLFDFGRGGSSGGGFGGGGGDQPYMFYSRRIGLNRGRVVPIDVGGRLTGKVGAFGVGVMNIQAGDDDATGSPATNFTVLRAKRDILRRSTIGAMFTNRNQSSVTAGGDNQAYGVDAAFGFYQNVSITGYYAQTQTTGVTGDNESFQGKFDWTPDRYGFNASVLKVGKAFNPEVGFLRRSDFTRSYAQGRFSPRPRNLRAVRKFTFEGSLEYFENGAGDVESRQQTGQFSAEFDNSDQLSFEANVNYDYLAVPFRLVHDVTIPVGGYHYRDARLSYNMGQQRRMSGNVSLAFGEYYSGTIRTLSFSQGRISILKQLSVEPRVSISRVELPTGAFTSRLYSARTDYGFSPRMFVGGLLQYNSADHTFSSNVRYRWEYRPGSEFFVVWTDEQDTNRLDPHASRLTLRNRAFVVKMTRLFRF